MHGEHKHLHSVVEGDGVHTFTVVARACAGAGGARSGFVQGVVGVAGDERILLRGECWRNIILAWQQRVIVLVVMTMFIQTGVDCLE